MKSFYYTDVINSESAQKVISFIEDNKGLLTIYLCNGGGENWATNALADCLALNHKRITIKALGEISSNAFKLFFDFKGKREILPDTIGMYHQSMKKMDMAENGMPTYVDDLIYRKKMRKNYPETLEWCKKLGFNKTEMRKLREGKDVWFTEERLRELLANQS